MPTYLEKPRFLQKSTWINCGTTVLNLLQLLEAKKGVTGFKKVSKTDYSGDDKDDPDVLYAELTNVSTKYTFIDVAIHDIHQFMIDKRPHVGHSLVNGYQSTYGALWWGGVSRYQQPEVRKDFKESDVQELWTLASEWGCGRRIDILQLARNLKALLAVGKWNAKGAVDAWKALPFFPKDTRVPAWNQRVDSYIKITVEVYTLDNIDTAFACYTGVDETSFLCPAILEFEARRLDVFDRWSI